VGEPVRPFAHTKSDVHRLVAALGELASVAGRPFT
jgi:hypothetical protein